MFLIGHVGFTVFTYWIYERIRGFSSDRNKILVAVGSMLPDLLDKPIGSLIFGTGRWLGHSLLFQLSVFLLLLMIDHARHPYAEFRTDVILLYFGSTLHLVGDFPGVGLTTLLWPFLGPFVPTGSGTFLLGVTSPFVVITEIIGLVLISTIGVYESWSATHWKVVGLAITSYLVLFVAAYSLIVGF